MSCEYCANASTGLTRFDAASPTQTMLIWANNTGGGSGVLRCGRCGAFVSPAAAECQLCARRAVQEMRPEIVARLAQLGHVEPPRAASTAASSEAAELVRLTEILGDPTLHARAHLCMAQLSRGGDEQRQHWHSAAIGLLRQAIPAGEQLSEDDRRSLHFVEITGAGFFASPRHFDWQWLQRHWSKLPPAQLQVLADAWMTRGAMDLRCRPALDRVFSPPSDAVVEAVQSYSLAQEIYELLGDQRGAAEALARCVALEGRYPEEFLSWSGTDEGGQSPWCDYEEWVQRCRDLDVDPRTLLQEAGMDEAAVTFFEGVNKERRQWAGQPDELLHARDAAYAQGNWRDGERLGWTAVALGQERHDCVYTVRALNELAARASLTSGARKHALYDSAVFVARETAVDVAGARYDDPPQWATPQEEQELGRETVRSYLGQGAALFQSFRLMFAEDGVAGVRKRLDQAEKLAQRLGIEPAEVAPTVGAKAVWWLYNNGLLSEQFMTSLKGGSR